MTFTFAQPLKLLGIGGSLITTTSLWFFNPHAPIQAQTRSSSGSSAKVRGLEDDDNINLFDPVPKLSSYSPKTSKFDEMISSPSVNSSAKEVTFTDPTTNKQKKLNYEILKEINDLKLGNILGYVYQYKEIKKETIKIHLFKQPAWFSSTDKDEYDTALDEGKINELFKGLDETKTKQLLLSLYKNREWYKFQEKYIARIPALQKTGSPEILTELKIKYFTDFEDLKTYVHKKVKESCTDDLKACIAHPDELTLPKADSLKYFNNQ